jgi:hypothetical protein
MPPTVSRLQAATTEPSEDRVVEILTSVHGDLRNIRALKRSFFQFSSIVYLTTIAEHWKESLSIHLQVLSILVLVTGPEFVTQQHGAILKLIVMSMTQFTTSPEVGEMGCLVLRTMMEEDIGAQLANNFLVRNQGMTLLHKALLASPGHRNLTTNVYLLVEYIVEQFAMFKRHVPNDIVKYVETAYKTLGSTEKMVSNNTNGSMVTGKAPVISGKA